LPDEPSAGFVPALAHVRPAYREAAPDET